MCPTGRRVNRNKVRPQTLTKITFTNQNKLYITTAKRFDFSSEFEDNTTSANNNDASSYIDASQDLEHAIAALREATEALNRATAEVNGNAEAMAEFNKQKKAMQKLVKSLDERTEAISKAATLKLTPEVDRQLNEGFVKHFQQLDQKLNAFFNGVEKKARSIVDEINTKDRRIAMPRADFWLNRILNYILIGTLGRILWVDIKTGITTDTLWNTFEWSGGIFATVIFVYYIVQGLREK